MSAIELALNPGDGVDLHSYNQGIFEKVLSVHYNKPVDVSRFEAKEVLYRMLYNHEAFTTESIIKHFEEVRKCI